MNDRRFCSFFLWSSDGRCVDDGSWFVGLVVLFFLSMLCSLHICFPL